jgi:hypothetical protein
VFLGVYGGQELDGGGRRGRVRLEVVWTGIWVSVKPDLASSAVIEIYSTVTRVAAWTVHPGLQTTLPRCLSQSWIPSQRERPIQTTLQARLASSNT